MLIPSSVRAGLSRSRGFSAVEILVGITVGLMVIAAATSLISTSLGSNSTAVRYTRLNQDLRGVLNAISYDLARAGSWAYAWRVVEVSAQTNLVLSATSGAVTVTAFDKNSGTQIAAFGSPFTSAGLQSRSLMLLMPAAGGAPTRYDLAITSQASGSVLNATIPSGTTLPQATVGAGSWTIVNPFNTVTVNSDNNCILFNYDLNSDGIRNASSGAAGQELFGYRYDSSQKAIEGTTSGTSCGGGSDWENITDNQIIRIDTFQITPIVTTQAASNRMTASVREYRISVTGRLRSDANSTRTVSGTVKVRNDAFY